MRHPGRPSLFIGRGRPLAPPDESQRDQASRDSSVGTRQRPRHIRAHCLNQSKQFHLGLSVHLEPVLPMLCGRGVVLLFQHQGDVRGTCRGLVWYHPNHSKMPMHLGRFLRMLCGRVMLVRHQVKLRGTWRELLCL